jgi:formylglycine-generating enzyme required for sulfatase activity
VRLDSGEARTERVTLRPVTGLVELSVQPEGVELVVDGRSRGPAPGSLELIAVPHRLEFRKPGFVSQTVSVTPTPGISQKVRVRLLTEAEAKFAAIPPRIRTPQGAELVLVPGGKFRMGSERREPGRRANEGLRDVELTAPFYIGTRPVTNREFREFRARHFSGTAVGLGLDGDDYPVVRVTWQDAAAFCNWLSDKEGLAPAYVEQEGRLVAVWPPPAGYRLPTEAEWAWVARYAGRTQAPIRYPWGNAMPPPAGAGNFADLSARGGLREVLTAYNDDYAATSPVGSFRSNSLGVFDLGGNVAEWMNDLYRAYTGIPGPPEVDPNGPEEGRYYVIRGSSWAHSSIADLRLAARDYGDEARPDLGFRVARSIN